MIERLNGIGIAAEQTTRQSTAPAQTGTFGDLLRQRLETVGAAETQGTSVEFSKHAQLRAEERGIEVSEDLLAKLSDSVDRAQAKGAKNILVFDAGRAFIVNVPQSRVVTAISGEEMQDNVFTNIDGAVLLK